MKTAIPEIRLDILIKQEEDYYTAHCLQFDLVATDDTVESVEKAIAELCIAHIQYSVENDNLDYLFSPAPQEIWAEYYLSVNNPFSISKLYDLDIPKLITDGKTAIPAFIAQEILYNVNAAENTQI